MAYSGLCIWHTLSQAILRATYETVIHSSMLQMGKVRLREVQQVSQDYTAIIRQSRD